MRLKLIISVTLFFLAGVHAYGQNAIIPKINQIKKHYESGHIKKAISATNELKSLLNSHLNDSKQVKTKSVKAGNLEPLMSILKKSAFNKTIWDLSIQFRSNEHPTLSTKEAIQKVDTFSKYEPLKEFQLAKQYRHQIKEILQGFAIYCNNIGQFLQGPFVKPIPVRFAIFNDRLALIVTDIASESIYNTIRSTAKSRAATVTASCLLPQLRYVYNALKDTNVEYFGMTIFYGSKNFLKDADVLNLKPEMLAIVVSKNITEDFVEGKITEDELVEQSIFYLSDRNMITFDLKKVKFQID